MPTPCWPVPTWGMRRLANPPFWLASLIVHLTFLFPPPDACLS